MKKKKVATEKKKSWQRFRLSEITIKNNSDLLISEFEGAKKGVNALSRSETRKHSFSFF